MAKPSRRAFTLIELLVVIAIIAVLIALLLARRPGGARGRTAVPVRQQYEADRPGAAQLPHVQRLLPAGDPHHDDRCRAATGTGVFSAQARLLGYMEQTAMYNAANFWLAAFNDSYSSYANQTVCTANISSFLCPSSPPASWPMKGVPYTANAAGNTYFASGGSSINLGSGAAATAGGPPNGVFMYSGPAIGTARHPGRLEQHHRLRRVEARRRQPRPPHALDRRRLLVRILARGGHVHSLRDDHPDLPDVDRQV